MGYDIGLSNFRVSKVFDKYKENLMSLMAIKLVKIAIYALGIAVFSLEIDKLLKRDGPHKKIKIAGYVILIISAVILIVSKIVD